MSGKNSKFVYYATKFLEGIVPTLVYRSRLPNLLHALKPEETGHIIGRVHYYNKLTTAFVLEDEAVRLADLSPKQLSAYYYDTRHYVRYFPEHFGFHREFGDVIKVPRVPRLLKSRPIVGDNCNSVLLKLNQVRHFNFVRDDRNYAGKKGMIVWRGKAKRNHHRSQVMKDWYQHPLCDFGQSNPTESDQDPAMHKPYMTVDEQLQCKFILSLEGNDVATNLKWIMSSNSLCFMRRPRYETWFMEGRLIPGKHFVELKDDFSDVEDKVSHYLAHPCEAELIIHNAQRWVRQFQCPRRELLISLLVLQKYFQLSGQEISKVEQPSFLCGNWTPIQLNP